MVHNLWLEKLLRSKHRASVRIEEASAPGQQIDFECWLSRYQNHLIELCRPTRGETIAGDKPQPGSK